jgi:hypothetical protein
MKLEFAFAWVFVGFSGSMEPRIYELRARNTFWIFFFFLWLLTILGYFIRDTPATLPLPHCHCHCYTCHIHCNTCHTVTATATLASHSLPHCHTCHTAEMLMPHRCNAAHCHTLTHCHTLPHTATRCHYHTATLATATLPLPHLPHCHPPPAPPFPLPGSLTTPPPSARAGCRSSCRCTRSRRARAAGRCAMLPGTLATGWWLWVAGDVRYRLVLKWRRLEQYWPRYR